MVVYVLCHYSAGMGRSGTYITLDTMLQCMAVTEDVNVYEFVCNVRMKRVFMIQTQVQCTCGVSDVHVTVWQGTGLIIERFQTVLLNFSSSLNCLIGYLVLHRANCPCLTKQVQFKRYILFSPVRHDTDSYRRIWLEICASGPVGTV